MTPPVASEEPHGRTAEREVVTFELDDLVLLLEAGELEVLGRLPRASNATMLAVVHGNPHDVPVVYKPRRGERPLWDFPTGTLCQREVAAFVVSQGVGWGLVPPTVMRMGPLGAGSVQLWITEDEDVDTIDLVESGNPMLQPLAVLDAVVNNADRKAGHCLVDRHGKLWAIDNGLSFNEEDKLRTVLWNWMGEPISEDLLDDLTAFSRKLADDADAATVALRGLLRRQEMAALRHRVRQLLAAGVFPEPDPYGPAVPWPPY